MLGPLLGGLIVGYFHWSVDLLRQHTDRPVRLGIGHRHLTELP